MKFFKALVGIFRSYEFRDWLISGLAVSAVLLMFVKMIFFPYGLFNFGEPDIYTEGLVARNGIQNINPVFVDYNEADREVSNLVFSGLMKYDPVTKAVVDDMGQLSINESKTEYTFTIRDGLKWQDGQDLTADDVYFTFNDVIMHPDFPNEILKTNFHGVQIEQTDSKTIVFKLEKPNIFFITSLTTGILPEHILNGVNPGELLQHGFNKIPIGSGPYMLTDPIELFSDNRMQVTLTRNPFYYGDPSGIKDIRFITYPKMEQLVEEANSVNGVVKVTGDFVLDFKNNERFELYPYELPQYTAVFMNMDSKILGGSKLVRLALQKAIDKEELLAQFVDKEPVDTPLMELNQEDWLYQASIEQARGALKDAGYTYADEDVDHAGIRYDANGDGLELNLVALAYEPDTPKYEESVKVVDFLVEKWKSIGVSVEAVFLNQDDFKSAIMTRSYDLLLVGQSMGYNLDTYSYWHSTQANPSGLNLSNYKSFAVDSLIEDIRAVFNLEKRARELNELAEIIKEDVPAIFLYRPVYYYASDGKVSGISMENVVYPSDRFSGVSLWKFE